MATERKPSDEACPHAPNRAGGFAAALILLAAIAIRLPWLAAPGFAIDQAQFVAWSEISRAGSELHPPGGIAAVYDVRPDGRRWCNYPPITVYVLRGLADVYDFLSPDGRGLDASVAVAVREGRAEPRARLAVALYKLPAILADGLTGALLFVILARRRPRRQAATVAIVYVLLPAVIHNSTLWGQVDALPTLLVLISLECARRGRPLWMTATATLAMLTKAQAAMMAPIWLAEAARFVRFGAEPAAIRVAPARLVREIVAGDAWLRSLKMLGIVVALCLIVFLPFHSALDGVWEAYSGAATYYPFTHLNGFSAWFLGTPKMIEPHLDAVPLSEWYVSDVRTAHLGLSPRTWGLLGLLVTWGFVLVLLWQQGCGERALAWAARILPLAFFILSTQMHERYLFPVMAIWAWTASGTRRWWLCWLAIGACASINVFWVWPGAGAWAATCAALLHRSWLGMAPGAWCSVGLIGVWVAAMLDRVDTHPRRLPQRAPSG